ncbi:bacteriohemerythrin [Pseudodesulfovibrio sp. zrk46]|uniref:bacteriohemerythrin n=1 Tax=Pseudodesulfovibrio sp. zrk46 TaxID=2725288 RepID=UPI00144937AE|nr:bacteriohemerythrin [Pseudodesulfovibrio sp. zrk46]QJB56679.1 hemerythrin family protein [Pseudodesulfovibrio sp. zrk46]
MPKIQWNKELSVGVNEIDDQHKELIKIANLLLETVEGPPDRNMVDSAIKQLREYTVFHFNSEEALMTEVRYPERGEHHAQHRKLKNDVKQFQRDMYEQQIPEPAVVLAFLRSWLLNHILTFDRKLAQFINDQKALEMPETTVSIGKPAD